MRAEQRRRSRQAGFTLLEVLLAAVLLVLVTAFAGIGLAVGQRVMADGMRIAQAKENVLRALAHMVPEIRESGTTTSGSGIAVEDGGRRLRFRKNIGFDGNQVIWSEEIVYEYHAEDGNGVAAGTITRTGPESSAAGAAIATTTVAVEIDPSFGFELNAAGDEVTITIGSSTTLSDGTAATFPQGGPLVERVRLRN
ncbi:MAG: hypothetical protein KatS3mg102_2276 [Planctomycetota bacterium]|nr:MAG: hypothetical protein KatS3mg102_2276 [Planctomycetota bacterium]